MTWCGTASITASPIVLAEWAERTNNATRIYMRHANLRRWARDYLDGLGELMTDDEAAACVADDIKVVQQLRGVPEDADAWARDHASWAAAARGYHEARGNQRLEIELREPVLGPLRALLDDGASLDRACAVGCKPSPGPTATLRAAELLLQQKDPARMRRWLSQHSAPEHKAILRHLERRKKRGGVQ
jgi:hypothetical protein